MSTTATTRLIGRLDLQSWMPDWTRDGETSSAPTFYQPTDVYLQNDGQMHNWMTEGVEPYELRHDGVGWVVTRGAWPYDGHTYRLASAGSLVDDLPLERDAGVTLARECRYAIRCTSFKTGGPVFDLYEIA